MFSDSGFKRFSDYTGYSDTFEWKCKHTDQCRLVDNIINRLCIIDGRNLGSSECCVQQKDLTVEMFQRSRETAADSNDGRGAFQITREAVSERVCPERAYQGTVLEMVVHYQRD